MNYRCPRCNRLYLVPGECWIDKVQLLPAPASITGLFIRSIASDPKTVRAVIDLGCYLVRKVF
jgi:hypothetical protein